MVQALQDDLSNYIKRALSFTPEDDTISNTIKPSLTASRNTFQELVDLLVTQLNYDVKLELEHLFAKKEAKKVEDLFDYLKMQLEILQNNLYPVVFQASIQKIFLIIAKDLELQLIPFNMEDDSNNSEKIPIVKQLIEELIRFFTADGTDLPSAYAEKHIRHLKDVISLFAMSTEELIEVLDRKRKSNRPIIVNEIYRSVSTPNPENGKEGTVSVGMRSPTNRRTVVTMSHSIDAAITAEKQEMIPSSFALPALSILKTRSKEGDATAKTALKTRKETLGSKLMCNLMGVYDEEENLIEKFLCAIQYTFGSLVVLSSFIALHKFIGSSHPAVLPLKDVVSVSKREDKGIMIVMNDGQEHLITSLYDVSRKHVIDVIKSRCKAVGNKIIQDKDNTSKQSLLEVDTEVLAGTTDLKSIEKWNRIVREKFGQSRESVLGVYSCYYRHTVPEFGHLLVTESVICFSSSRPLFPHHVAIPFSEVSDVSAQNAWILPTALCITNLEDKKFVFSSLSARDTAYNLIVNLWYRRAKYTTEEK